MLEVVTPTSPVLRVPVLLDGVARSSLWSSLRGGEGGLEHPARGLTHSSGIRALLSSADPCYARAFVWLPESGDNGRAPLPWCYKHGQPLIPACTPCSPRVWGEGQHRVVEGEWCGLAPLLEEEPLPGSGRNPRWW